MEAARKQGVRLCLMASLLSSLSGCPAGGTGGESSPPTPALESPAPATVQPEQVKAPPPTLAQQAQVYAEEAQKRFDNSFQHPELNAYFEIIKLPAAEYGTAVLFDLYQKKGPKALFDAVDGKAGEKLGPFIAQVKAVKSLLRYQYLTVPVEVPSTGPVVFADDSKFIDVLKGVALAPILDAHSTSKEPDSEPSTEYPVLTLQVGRKVSFQASCLKHLELGVAMQAEGLSVLRKLLKDRVLSSEQLSSLVAEIQSLDGNERDFLRVADGEYLVAKRKYENQGLGESGLSKKLSELTARYLELRPLLENHGPAPKDLTSDGEVFGKEKDLLGPYDRWRATTTEVAAVEILAALELHRLNKKSYPEQLSALGLTRIPRDYFSKDGQFNYKKEGDGYRLETVSSQIPGHRQGTYRW